MILSVGPRSRIRRIEASMRVLDVVVSASALLFLAPLIGILAVGVKLASRGPAFFVQTRVGRNGRPFRMLKLRSMAVDAPGAGPTVTATGDPRVTPFGALLRRTKLDELPQLFNVLRGDMSLVGSRPEVPSMVARCAEQYAVLHLVRPGITSPATLVYSDEESMLPAEGTEEYYVRKVLPAKLALDLEWLRDRSLLGDLELLTRTALRVLRVRRSVEPLRVELSGAVRLGVKAAMDLGVVLIAWFAANLLRFDGLPPGEDGWRTWSFALPVALVALLSLRAAGMNDSLWRFFSGRDGWTLSLCAVPAVALMTLLRVWTPESLSFLRTPYSVIAMTGLISVAGWCALRLCWSGMVTRAERRANPRPDLHGTAVICGAGSAGQQIVGELLRAAGRHFRPLGFFDDDPVKQGRRLQGVRVVGGLDEVPVFLHQHRPDVLLVAMKRVAEDRLRPVVEAAYQCGVEIRILPSALEAGSGQGATSLRDLRIEDLIGRPSVRLDPAEERVASVYKDRTVLVTGAGGSIGSELVRQLLLLEPRRMLLLDKDENSVFALARELKELAPRQDCELVVMDLRDRRSLVRLLRREKPEVVLHAAAHKHVPLMERNAVEAVANNVLGTQGLARLCAAAGVKSFVFVSTDKAVNPLNVMGATKRCGELLVRELASRGHPFSVVRFGNVLGSRGSVVETFLHQIQHGGPLTVHHEEVERFFLSIPEAAQLVLVAGARPGPEGCYVLEMGRPVRIADLARDLVRLSGRHPDSIPIVTTQMRPAEKLHEELSVGGSLTPVPGVSGLLLDPEDRVDAAEVDRLLRRLQRAVAEGDEGKVRQILGEAPVCLATAPETRVLPTLAGPSLKPVKTVDVDRVVAKHVTEV